VTASTGSTHRGIVRLTPDERFAIETGIQGGRGVLPRHMEWANGHGVETLPASMAWALYALNFSWSLLLLTVSGIVLYAAIRGAADAFARRVSLAVGLFWTIHGGYVLVNPMPLPQRLVWLRFAIPIFPMTLIALHWLPLWVTRRRKTVDGRASERAMRLRDLGA
jgi:hypothetical protein